MKPRLYKYRGIWHCLGVPLYAGSWTGLGYTAAQAYNDWATKNGTRA